MTFTDLHLLCCVYAVYDLHRGSFCEEVSVPSRSPSLARCKGFFWFVGGGLVISGMRIGG